MAHAVERSLALAIFLLSAFSGAAALAQGTSAPTPIGPSAQQSTPYPPAQNDPYAATPPGQYAPPPQYGTTPPPGQYAAPPPPPPGAYQPPPPGAYQAPPPPPPPPSDGGFTIEEITQAGHRFFGRVSMGLARVIEHAFARAGRPNGYILGEEAGGAFIAGLRYGEGTLYTKDAGQHKVYWQGPTVGWDFGAAGSKTMILVYSLHDINEIYDSFAGIDGSAYFIGGVGITFMSRGNVTLAPIRSGVGLRLGANIGYLKFTRRPTWNPF